jgi:plasmid stabilization system protein ParE
MAHRIAARAEADLDDIWLYVAKESGSMDVADRLIDSITERFLFLANFLMRDALEIWNLDMGCGASLSANL